MSKGIAVEDMTDEQLLDELDQISDRIYADIHVYVTTRHDSPENVIREIIKRYKGYMIAEVNRVQRDSCCNNNDECY